MSETVRGIQAFRALQAVESGVQRVESVAGLLAATKNALVVDSSIDSRFVPSEEILSILEKAVDIANEFISKTSVLVESLDGILDEEENK